MLTSSRSPFVVGALDSGDLLGKLEDFAEEVDRGGRL